MLHAAAWWLPFSLFLLDGSALGARLRSAAPHACAAFNAAGAVAMLLFLRRGLPSNPDAAVRATWISENPLPWRAGWALWMGAGSTLVAFLAWWGARLPGSRRGTLAFAVAAAGLACDLLAESLLVGWIPERMARIERTCGLLSGAGANGLYTLAGTILTLGTPGLRGARLAWTWAVWISGYALAAATVLGSFPAMVASTAALMALFCPWVWVVGRKLA